MQSAAAAQPTAGSTAYIEVYRLYMQSYIVVTFVMQLAFMPQPP